MKKNYSLTFHHFLKLVILLFLSVLVNENTHAQWTKTNGPPGINVNTFYDNGTFLFAGTSSKGAFRSSDHGLTWTAVNKGLENSTVLSFLQDESFLYAGTNTGVFRSSDNGATWTAANSGIQTQFIGEMTIGGGYLFAGTTSDGVRRSPDHGTTWQNANGGALDFTAILAMCYVNNVLIVEGDNFIFRSPDNGNTWFVDQGSTEFYPINNFLVIGDTILASAYGGVFHTYNGGLQWSNFLMVNPNFNLVGFAYANGIVYAGSQDAMYQSPDFGKTWSRIAATGLRIGTRFNNCFAKSGNNFLLGMDELGVFHSSDTGSTWSQSISGMPSASSIDNCLLAMGDDLWTGTHSDGVYKSGNNGKSWKKKGTTNNNDTLSNGIIFSMFNPAPNIILAGTCGDGLYRSTNNGKSWKHITSGLPFKQFGNYECDQSFAKSGSTIILGTTNGIYYSTNDGKSWNASNFTGDRKNANAVAANGNIAVAGVSEGVSPFQSGIYRSTDNGHTWVFQQAVLDIVSMASDGIDHFYAGTFEDNWRSLNNGNSFSQIGNGIPGGIGGFTIKVINTNNVFIGNNTGIYFSSNQGSNFSNVSTGLDPAPNNSVQGLEANSTYLFAGLFQDAVWKRPLSDFGISTPLAQRETNELNENALLVYPNPFSDQTTIQYRIDHPGEVSLTITDLAGRIVFESKENANAGDYSKTIDGKNLAPGIYFAKLRVNGKLSFAKLMIEK